MSKIESVTCTRLTTPLRTPFVTALRRKAFPVAEPPRRRKARAAKPQVSGAPRSRPARRAPARARSRRPGSARTSAPREVRTARLARNLSERPPRERGESTVPAAALVGVGLAAASAAALLLRRRRPPT